MTSWNHDFYELRQLYPEIELSLMICENTKCTKNSTIMPTAWCYDDNIPYMVRLQCSACKKEWMVCKTCKLKKKLELKRQINSHKWKYHDRKSLFDSNLTCKVICSSKASQDNHVFSSTGDNTSSNNNSNSMNDNTSSNNNSSSTNDNNANSSYDINEEDNLLGKIILIYIISFMLLFLFN